MDSALQYTSVSHAGTMMGTINRMRLSSDLCDVAVVVGNFRIMAHRLILSASAPFFYQMLSLKSGEPSNTTELLISDVDEAAALKIIEFCYTSSISLDTDSVWPLLSAAIKFEFSEVCSLCHEFLASELDIRTCLRMHLLAVEYACKEMILNSKTFIEDNINKVCQSSPFLSLGRQEVIQLLVSLVQCGMDGHSVGQLVTAWLDHDVESRREATLEFVDALPCVRNVLREHVQFLNKASQADGDADQNGSGCVKKQDTVPLTKERELQKEHKHSDNVGWMSEMGKNPCHDKQNSEVPIHICISCGEAFDTALDLRKHQLLCDESVNHGKLEEHCGNNTSNGGPHQTDSPSVDSLVPEISSNCFGSESVPEYEGCSVQETEGELSLSATIAVKLSEANASDHAIESLHQNEPSEGLCPLRDSGNEPKSKVEMKNRVNRSEKLFANGDTQLEGSVSSSATKGEKGESSSQEGRGQSVNDTNNNDIHRSRQPGACGSPRERTLCDDGNAGHQNINGCDVSPHCQQKPTPSSKSQNAWPSVDGGYADSQGSGSQAMLRFKCQICGKAFVERKGLGRHWRQAHGIESVEQETSWRDGAHQTVNDHNGMKWEETARNGCLENGTVGKMKKLEPQGRDEEPESVSQGLNLERNGFGTSTFINNYIQHYSELAKWCGSQGFMLCKACNSYHSSSVPCPPAVDRARLDGVEDGVNSSGDGDDSESVSIDVVNDKDEESDDNAEPLDMSKSSTDASLNNSSGLGLSSSLSSLSEMSVPMDLSQYYLNYARFLAASNGDVSNLAQLPSQSYLSYKPHEMPSEPVYRSFPPYHSSSSSSSSLPPSSTFPSTLQALPKQASPSPLTSGAQNSKSLSRTSQGSAATGKRKTTSRQGFPCTVCDRVFSYQAALFTHMHTHSPSARAYRCQLCGETFARAPDLKVHVCPNGVEKPFTCPSCGQTFAKNIHLKRHLATHSGLKPYPCWVCGKRFSRSDHLKRHTQSIHAGTRPHVCQVCGKEFVRKYELNKHMQGHALELTALGSVSPSAPTVTTNSG